MDNIKKSIEKIFVDVANDPKTKRNPKMIEAITGLLKTYFHY